MFFVAFCLDVRTLPCCQLLGVFRIHPLQVLQLLAGLRRFRHDLFVLFVEELQLQLLRLLQVAQANGESAGYEGTLLHYACGAAEGLRPGPHPIQGHCPK